MGAVEHHLEVPLEELFLQLQEEQEVLLLRVFLYELEAIRSPIPLD